MNTIFIVSFVTFIVAEITKMFDFPKRLIPVQNMGVGFIAAIICFIFDIVPATAPIDYLTCIIECLIASMGAGGFYDVLNTKKAEMVEGNLDYKEAVAKYGEPEKELPVAPISHDYQEALTEDEGAEG